MKLTSNYKGISLLPTTKF